MMTENIPNLVLHFFEESDFGTLNVIEPITQGHINQAYRLKTNSGRSFILKQNAELLDRMFEYEAAGLQTLRSVGMRTPEVFLFAVDFLLIEDLGTPENKFPDWEAFGHAVAHQHLHRHKRFGFDYDNYLGSLPQINTWTDDGHEFFGQHRVLRYLSEPKCENVLTVQDRHNLEQLVKRLPELVPVQPASLLHGDLWHTNMLFDAEAKPALIDPAVYYGWAEAELSMTRQYGVVPQVFYNAYNEVNPLEAGWWDRLELLYIRQLMAVLAFFGNQYNTLEQLRDVIAKFS